MSSTISSESSKIGEGDVVVDKKKIWTKFCAAVMMASFLVIPCASEAANKKEINVNPPKNYTQVSIIH
jgi:hypothetical protein